MKEVCEKELDEVDVAQDVDDDRRAGHISEYAESPLEPGTQTRRLSPALRCAKALNFQLQYSYVVKPWTSWWTAASC